MNQRQRFIRKIVYACVIAALLLPLSWLSQPATTESDGGMLAQMRKEHQLSQAQLGDIDPASETIKLATLGMRGVAANILWDKANYYKKTEDWVSYSATLEQIAKLQPNFVSVWVYQAWNLSYNISVEFDDYRDRYYWVIKGIDFLKEGTQYNKDEPRLLSDIGWTIAWKIGRADEHVQFRRLFREDDDFNGARPLAQRDNWLVGREWLSKSEGVVARGVPLKGKNPLLFYSQAVMCLINFSEAIEEEGTFGEVAKNAWRKAADAWTEFADRDMPSQYNVMTRLSDKEQYDEKSKVAQAELARLAPGIREAIAAEKLARLSQRDREAYETPDAERTREQKSAIYGILEQLQIHHLEVAERVTGENQTAALKAAEDATQADFMSGIIDTDRGIVNYDYWTRRCRIEPEEETLSARESIYLADQEFSRARLVESKNLYLEGIKNWRKVLDAHPVLLKDSNLVDELAESIGHYRSVLHQLDEKFPEPFLLKDVVDADVEFRGPRLPPTQRAPTDEADAAANDPGKNAP